MQSSVGVDRVNTDIVLYEIGDGVSIIVDAASDGDFGYV